jgi:hypothetical protein
MTQKVDGLTDQNLINSMAKEERPTNFKRMESNIKPSSNGPSEPEDPKSAKLMGRERSYLDKEAEAIRISKIKKFDSFLML